MVALFIINVHYCVTITNILFIPDLEGGELRKDKDTGRDFVHKAAGRLSEKKEQELMREKLQVRLAFFVFVGIYLIIAKRRCIVNKGGN